MAAQRVQDDLYSFWTSIFIIIKKSKKRVFDFFEIFLVKFWIFLSFFIGKLKNRWSESSSNHFFEHFPDQIFFSIINLKTSANSTQKLCFLLFFDEKQPSCVDSSTWGGESRLPPSKQIWGLVL